MLFMIAFLHFSSSAYAIDTHGGRSARASGPYTVPANVDSNNRKAACQHYMSPRCSGAPHEQLGRILELSCHAQRDSSKCDEIETNVQDKSILLNCDSSKICSSTVSDLSAKDCIINGFKISGDLLLAMNPVKLAADLYKGVTHSYAAAASCFENKNGEKTKMIEAYEMMVDPRTPKWHLSDGAKEAMISNYNCSQLESNLSSRLNSQQNEIMAYIQAGKMAPLPASESAKKALSLSETIENLQKNLGLPLQCYTPKAQAELACSLVTTAVVMTGLVVVTGGATTLAVNAFKKKLAEYGASRAATARVLAAVAERTNVNLADAGLLSNSGRLKSAGELVGRTLGAEERKAVISAHEIGSESGAGFGTYTPEQIRQKVEILKNAGFSQEERFLLMRNGITGEASTQAPALSLSADQARARLTTLQENSSPSRSLNSNAKYNREQENRMFDDAQKLLNDRSARPADRMNAARMAGQQSSNYGDTEMARAFGRTGVKEAKAAYAEAKATESGLTMEVFLSRRGSNFVPNYETAANLARDRDAITQAAGVRMRQETLQTNKLTPNEPRISVQEYAVVRAGALESDFSQLTAKPFFQAASTAQKAELRLSSLRQRLAVMEGGGVSENSSALIRVRQELQKLDPTYLQPKP